MIISFLCVSIILSGCKSSKDTTSGSGSQKTLTFWSPLDPTVKDMNTNAYTQYVEKEMNVKIKFDQVAGTEWEDKLNLSLASGSYPDVYYSLSEAPDVSNLLIKFGMQSKIFLPLNSYIDKYGTNTKKVFAQDSWIKNAVTEPDGNIYGLPTYSSIQHVVYAQAMWINQGWLTKLHLSMPTTTDEFENVLKAFVSGDPNGNGKKDELGIVGAANGWYSNPVDFLMCSFIYDDGNTWLTLDNGKISSILNTAAYREGLQYVNKLYKEGLIYPASFTQTPDQSKTIGSQSTEIVGATPTGASVTLADYTSPLYKDLVEVPPLKGPEGVQTCGYFPYGDIRAGAYIITKSCKDPELAFKVADFMYSQDASIRLRQGVEGVDWRPAQTGEKTFDGKDTKWMRITTLDSETVQNNNTANTGLWSETNASYMGDWGVGPNFNIFSADGVEQLLYQESEKYVGHEPNDSVPPISFLPAEATELAQIQTDVQKYAKQAQVQFVTGQLSLSGGWSAYLSNLTKLKLDRLVQIYQTAYDRQYGSK